MNNSFWLGTAITLLAAACGGNDIDGGSSVEDGGSGGSAGAGGKAGSLSFAGTPSAGASSAGSSSAGGSSSVAGAASAGSAQGGSVSGAGGSNKGGASGSGGMGGHAGTGVTGVPMGIVQTCFGTKCPIEECDNTKFFSETLCTDVYDGPVAATSMYCALDGSGSYCLSINDTPNQAANVLYAVNCTAGVPTILLCDGGCGRSGDGPSTCN